MTGKPAGDDLSVGNPTHHIPHAHDPHPPAHRAHLDQSLGKPLTDAEVGELRALIDGSGARQQVEDVITALTERALTALDAADIRDEARAVLRDLAAAATQRTV
jgi:geranylgeranyl diphosphate synthase type I